MKRFVLSLLVVSVLSSVACAGSPRGYGVRSGYSGAGGIYGPDQRARPYGWYDYYAAQAALRSQRLYGPVPGAGGFGGGSGFGGGDVQFSSPQYIVNPFCK